VPETAGFSIEDQRMRSLLTARVARDIAKGSPQREDTFTAAMVHDVGKVVLACGRPSLFARVLHLAKDRKRPLHDLERQAFGASHAEVGAYLLGVWGLPMTIVEAVAFHHEPGKAANGDHKTIGAVHVADVIVDGVSAGEDDETIASRLDMEFLATAGITPDLPRWRGLLEDAHAGGQ
jgi:HD-like signal output (HDOD) protein